MSNFALRKLWLFEEKFKIDVTYVVKAMHFNLSDDSARILELQRCHPAQLSRFLLVMSGDAVLTRVDDSALCPQSNYKSLLLSRETSALEACRLLLQLCRLQPSLGERDVRLFLHHDGIEAPLPDEVRIAQVYAELMSNQKLVLRRVT